MNVGIRELKAKLSEYLGLVADGEAVVVTDRGRPVARLVPYDHGSAVERGIAEGWIRPPLRVGLLPSVRVHSSMTTEEALDEDRGR
ncbi:MAG: type II toxin-antitoxin system prevent-host-death family antitoxin [Acidimicrobiia bacterium]|nr:type II toxin-antitoxin system prevent-host-death family antitoxin [Actinomycetota bacterium]MBL6924613.1 type II toxin-antitoxin system prevent-host-death family antitoxin [Acidimicrobiia bacterium]MBL6925956.1 type II toxin-antitoxin system prevent-host-death family antitoxin [Acidimicrobiia bacterium]